MGEIRLDKNIGYYYFYEPKHPLANKSGKVYLHRVVASEKIGRWLTTEEHVHHIDGNKTNNSPENIMILTASEHSILEWEDRPRQERKKCRICENPLNDKNNSGICKICISENPKNMNPKNVPNKRIPNDTCSICGNPCWKSGANGICSNCFPELTRKFNPTKEELSKLIWEMPTTKVAEIFGVSDKAIEKRCKLFGIEKPPRGYWAKKYSKKIR